jgi:Bacterial Ig-like domain (group 3)
MRLKQSLAAAFAAMAVVAVSVGVSASTAQAATSVVTLPITHYSHMLVDPAHQHLFITSGSGSSSILVTDYSGQTVATIPDEPGATGLALSDDGSTVYAALADGDAISAISTSALSETARYATGTGTDPTYVAFSSGKIWFGYGAAAQGGIGSIDPSTSPAAVTLNAASGFWYAAPMVAATAGGELVAGEPGQSPVQLASYDVSSGTATVLAPEKYLYEAANLRSMQITPDGKDVVLASGAPYYQEVFQVSDLSAAGTYPTTNYPTSVSIAVDGTVAAGTCCGYAADGSGTNEIFIFAPSSTTPENTIRFGYVQLANDGAALTPDGSLLFAVTLASVPTLNIIPNPEQPAPNPTSTVVTCSPGTVAIGQATSCTATVTDTASSGSTTPAGTVTFTSDTSGGSFSSSSCALSPANSSGQASCSVSYTPGQAGSGTETITGKYGGDSAHTASSGQDTITVTLRATITAVTCQQVKPVLDKCTATVSDTSPGTATTPTGTVSFTSSGHGVFSATRCTLSASGASASCAVYYGTSAGVPMTGQTVTASYDGDGTHQSSTGSTTLT